MSGKTVRDVVKLGLDRPARGFDMYGLRHAELDPFMDVTLFSMSEPTFPPHPHAGFSAVTYMVPESAGSFINRDSLGDHTEISPGDTHWTQAGAGMMHEEVPSSPGTPCRGFQMFVKLSADQELTPPQAFHLNAEETPRLDGNCWSARVVTGMANDRRGGLIETRHDAFLVDVTAEPSAAVEIRLTAGASCWVFVRAGSVSMGDETVDAVSAIILSREGETVSFRSGADGAVALIGGGSPLGEDFFFGGPFALSTADRLAEAKRRFAAGGMGRLTPSF